MKAKKIYKKDIKVITIKYHNNVKTKVIKAIRIFGRVIGYLHYINQNYKYEVDLFNNYLFIENVSQKHYVDNYNELRELLRGYHLNMDLA